MALDKAAISFKEPKIHTEPISYQERFSLIKAQGKGLCGGWPLLVPSCFLALMVTSIYHMFLFHLFPASTKPVGYRLSSS